MRRLFLVAACATVLVAAADSPAADPAPRIQVEPEGFDFGRVLPRRTLRKEFRLLNLGDGPLEISGVTRSCGCTRAVVGETTLEPGAATTLTVEVETRTSKGRIQQQVLVRSNDPGTPALEVKLSATVVAEEPK
jgi:Protein of unknown function (DUF1573)